MQGPMSPTSLCPRCRAPLPHNSFTVMRCSHCGLELNLAPALPEKAAPVGQGGIKGWHIALLAFFVLQAAGSAIFLFFGYRSKTTTPHPSLLGNKPTEMLAEAPLNLSDHGTWIGGPSSELAPLLVEQGAESWIIGIGSDARGSAALLAVDAQSGSVRWRNASITEVHAQAFSDRKQWLLLGRESDFMLRAVDVSAGALRWERKLSDHLSNISFGDGCVVAISTNEARQPLDLTTGQPLGACPSAPPASTRTPMDFSASKAFGDISLALSLTSPGTPRLIVRASRAKQQLWEQTLPLTTDKPLAWYASSSIARTAHGFVLLGQTPGSTALSVMLLDVQTGKVTATLELPQKSSYGGGAFLRIAANDQIVAVQSFGNVQSLALPSLRLLWKTNSMFLQTARV